MKTISFMQALKEKREEKKWVSVGLDTDFDEIPPEVVEFLRKRYNLASYEAQGPVMFAFNRTIIEATCDIVACYKINPEFYAASGLQGFWALERTAEYLHDMHLGFPWIFDRKYGDVGHTNKASAHYAFGILKVGAVTVNPWGGREDGLDVFLKYKNKGIFIWCRGSNKGAREIQDIKITTISGGALCDEPIYELIAERVSGFIEYVGPSPELGWNISRNCGLVMGATYPEQLAQVRRVIGDMPILIPGIGAQKGDLAKTVKAAVYIDPETGKKSLPAIFNSSRSIIYASEGEDFAEVARQRTLDLNIEIVKIFEEVSA